MEKAGEEKGVCGGVWECGKPERFSIISMPRSRGKGRGGFLFKPPKGALFGSPFPPIVFSSFERCHRCLIIWIVMSI